MKANNLTIIPPEEMEVYQEGNEIKFRPIEKKLTYRDIAKKLFKNKITYYPDAYCNIKSIDAADVSCYDANNCTSEKQLKKLLAINQLMNVAKYLNKDWTPNWDEAEGFNKYCIWYNITCDKLIIDASQNLSPCGIYFKSEELAQQAIEILGEETIKLALSTDW